MSHRQSEIRSFLLRHAEKRGIRIQEHKSLTEEKGRAAFFCHIQAPIGEPVKSATAVSYDCLDNALIMAFLSYGDSNLDFLPDKS